MKRIVERVVGLARVVALQGAGLALLGGCAAAPAGYDLRLSLEPEFARSLGDEGVFVHLVPITARNRWDLQAMAVDDYWQYGGGPARPGVEREMGTRMFDLSALRPSATLTKEDAAWRAWSGAGAGGLMVLASRPAPAAPAAGELDPRRRIVPLRRSGGRPLDVVVTDAGLDVQDPARPRRPRPAARGTTEDAP